MKIIKEGTSYRNWKSEITCKICESFLEIDANDLVYKEITDMNRNGSYDVNTTYSCICAFCKSKITLNEKEIPLSVKNFLSGKKESDRTDW